MKQLLLILFLIPLPLLANDYYWYKGTKIGLNTGNKEYVVYESNAIQKVKPAFLYEDSISLPTNAALKWGIINKGAELGTDKIIYKMTSYISSKDSTDVFITDKFYVKLHQFDDFQLLACMASMYHLEILSNTISPLWNILRCTERSQYNALELANIFYESNKFEACEPEFIGFISKACTNDPYFNLQWNLRNTGQHSNYGNVFDINYCDVHMITSGNTNTIIAVYDFGVELSHPDINIYPLSYDAHTTSSPNHIYDDHGTACAGIIGALKNNQLGIAGIASSCPIMSISLSGFTSSMNLANGFIFAADNGCSVISCSWETSLSSSVIDDAISYAIQQGRDGLGCIIVFASGNDNKAQASYPANSNEDILVVGAMSPCGERKSPQSCDNEYWWGSNYGSNLDVVAPGVLIPTTDLTGTSGYTETDYILDFNGTSSACPHVAAIAGLILSMNQNLTRKEVVDIIENTAQKVGNYTYSLIADHPNGTWNNEVGYGLVDAYAAVMAAKTKYLQNQTYLSGNVITEHAPIIIAGSSVTNSKPYGDVILEEGSNVTLAATEQVVLKSGVHAKNGCQLHIKTGPANETISATALPQCMPSYTPSTTEITDIHNSVLESFESIDVSSISVYTISGQLLQKSQGADIDLSSLPSGFYVLQKHMTDGSVVSETIVKN